jgi:ParB family chromosome partitioning protein
VAKNPSLGKGLASLFPGVQAAQAAQAANASAKNAANASSTNESTKTTGGATAAGPAVPAQLIENKDRQQGIALARIEDIQVNQYQPRRDFDDSLIQELAQSIRANGIIQPLVVRKGAQGGYELIAGERRLRASKLAGLKQVPVVIRRSTDREALELALIENIQRQNLNCIDEALAYFQLIQDFQLTQEEVAQRVGKDRTTVSNFLRLLRLPEAIIDDLKRQILSFGHGKALLGLEDSDLRLRARAQIVEKRLSVRDAEALVEQLKRGEAGNVPAPGTGNEKSLTKAAQRLVSLAQDLTRQWSTRVEVKGSEKRGKIVLHYGSRQDLDRILEAMQNHKI